MKAKDKTNVINNPMEDSVPKCYPLTELTASVYIPKDEKIGKDGRGLNPIPGFSWCILESYRIIPLRFEEDSYTECANNTAIAAIKNLMKKYPVKIFYSTGLDASEAFDLDVIERYRKYLKNMRKTNLAAIRKFHKLVAFTNSINTITGELFPDVLGVKAWPRMPLAVFNQQNPQNIEKTVEQLSEYSGFLHVAIDQCTDIINTICMLEHCLTYNVDGETSEEQPGDKDAAEQEPEDVVDE